MGDIVRTVEFHDLLVGSDGLTTSDRPTAIVQGLLDTGSSMSVVPREVADHVQMVRDPTRPKARLEGRDHDVWLTVLRIADAPGCEHRMLHVVVSDELAGRTKIKGVSVIIGHDYMQVARMGLLLREARQQTAYCLPPPRLRGTRKRGGERRRGF